MNAARSSRGRQATAVIAAWVVSMSLLGASVASADGAAAVPVAGAAAQSGSRDAIAAPIAGTTISGTVTGERANLRGRVRAELWETSAASSWSNAGSVRVGDDGRYAFDNVPDGSYTVHFWDQDDVFRDEWWNNQRYSTEAETIVVRDGRPVSGIDASLTVIGGTEVSGSVSWEHPFLTGTINVELFSATNPHHVVAARIIGDDGRYSFGHIENGSYKLRFWDEDEIFLDEWWGDGLDFASAGTIVIRDERPITGLDASLTVGAKLWGKVKFPPAPDGDAGAYTIQAYSASDASMPVATFESRSDSGLLDHTEYNFVLSDLRAGKYKLRYASDEPRHFVQWSGGKASFADAAVVTLSAGESRTDLEFAPVLGARITGSVLLPAGTDRTTGETRVRVYSANDPKSPVASAVVERDGTYAVTPLRPGAYRLFASTTHPVARSEWWNDRSSFQVADTVTLRAGQFRRGVDVTLSSTRSVAWTTPTITGGTPVVGKTLTAVPGAWTKGAGFTYRWLADGVAITGGTRATFTVTDAQAGKKITVRIKGSKSGLAAESKTSVPTSEVLRKLASATPKISGTVAVGKTLSAKPGSWTVGTKYSYQWFANGKAIRGATKNTFVATPTQAGSKITVTVGGSKSGFASVSKTSAAVGVVTGGKLTAATPKVSGTRTVGKTLKAVPGSWTSGTKLSFQWLANGKPISKATGASHALTANEVGKKITVRVTGSKIGFTSVTKTSAATSAVKSRFHSSK